MRLRDRIDAGLDLAAAGIADGRAQLERSQAAVDAARASLGEAEQRFHSLAHMCARARQGRHLRVGETAGPRRPLRDGPPLLAPTQPVGERHSTPTPLPPAPKPVSYTPQECLVIYGLHRADAGRMALDQKTAWRRILRGS